MFLTYHYLLVVLSRFSAHHPRPVQRNRDLLRRWFWRAAMVGPVMFSGWTQAMRALTSHVRPDDEGESVQSLLKAVESFSLIPPVPHRFRSTAASSRMLLCAMWALQPRSVLSGEPYDRSQLSKSLEGRKTAVDIVFTILKREPGGGQARSSRRRTGVHSLTPRAQLMSQDKTLRCHVVVPSTTRVGDVPEYPSDAQRAIRASLTNIAKSDASSSGS